MRKIPTKNYIIALIITIVTLLLTLFLTNYFLDKREYENETNMVMNFVSEVKSEEFDNFIVENQDIMIYISNSDIADKELQKKVKKIITKGEFSDDMVYLNMKNIDESFYQHLSDNYFDSSLINTNVITESIIIVKNKKIINIINVNEDNISSLKKDIERIFYGD